MGCTCLQGGYDVLQSCLELYPTLRTKASWAETTVMMDIFADADGKHSLLDIDE